MWTRRFILTAAAATLLAAPAGASDWRAQYPEVVFSIIPSENAGGVLNRYEPLMQHLSTVLGVKVTLRVANDYAAVIEAMRSGQVHVAHFGPSAYARAYQVTNGDVEPFATAMNSAGAVGYYSVLYVRADDKAQSIQDLKGKNLCLVDPNSTSGNNVPRFAMDKMGIDPDAFFGKLLYSGSHENAVTALLQGTCDAAFNWWNTEKESNLLRMAARGAVKADSVRIIMKSDLIPGSPTTLKRSLPEAMKADIKRAFLEAPVKGREAWLRISDGNATGYHEVKHEDYQVIIDLNRFVDRLRRKPS
ncbi:phosphonate ABC transporter substrate-binding protein [Hyphomicrobium sp. CS1BSMeth3]|uniref:phosphonate ABC transporter substrate-binding protein n=1 Tax=Hyphomicrobium sp. CS1BSMeth3 TaxID=1892844 RepID=UPI00093119AB|nr:phosphonate ABC transporter substrate-binding protein [Hyphomicrobium sp. CS1BSMeth3]